MLSHSPFDETKPIEQMKRMDENTPIRYLFISLRAFRKWKIQDDVRNQLISWILYDLSGKLLYISNHLTQKKNSVLLHLINFEKIFFDETLDLFDLFWQQSLQFIQYVEIVKKTLLETNDNGETKGSSQNVILLRFLKYVFLLHQFV